MRMQQRIRKIHVLTQLKCQQKKEVTTITSGLMKWEVQGLIKGVRKIFENAVEFAVIEILLGIYLGCIYCIY